MVCFVLFFIQENHCEGRVQKEYTEIFFLVWNWIWSQYLRPIFIQTMHFRCWLASTLTAAAIDVSYALEQVAQGAGGGGL